MSNNFYFRMLPQDVINISFTGTTYYSGGLQCYNIETDTISTDVSGVFGYTNDTRNSIYKQNPSIYIDTAKSGGHRTAYVSYPNQTHLQYLQINNVVLNSNGFSVAFWFRINVSFLNANIFTFSDSTNISPSNRVSIQLTSLINSTSYGLSAIVVNAGTTTTHTLTTVFNNNGSENANSSINLHYHYHCAWTLTPSGVSTVYINNVLDSVQTGLVYNQIPYPTNYIGYSYSTIGASYSSFNGYITEFRKYDTALVTAVSTSYLQPSISDLYYCPIFVYYYGNIRMGTTIYIVGRVQWNNMDILNVGRSYSVTKDSTMGLSTYFYWNSTGFWGTEIGVSTQRPNNFNPLAFSYTYNNTNGSSTNAIVNVYCDYKCDVYLNSIFVTNMTYAVPPNPSISMISMIPGNNVFTFYAINNNIDDAVILPNSAMFACYVTDSGKNKLFDTDIKITGWTLTINGYLCKSTYAGTTYTNYLDDMINTFNPLTNTKTLLYGSSELGYTIGTTYNPAKIVQTTYDIGNGNTITNNIVNTNFNINMNQPNTGKTWTLSGNFSNSQIKSAELSYSGQYGIIADNSGGIIYYSNNYGNNWNNSNSVTGTWSSCAMNYSGQYATAAINVGLIYYSASYGVNWTVSNSISTNWVSMAMSSTGQYCVSCYNGGIYWSDNYGQTWNISKSDSSNYVSLSMSATGQYVIAASNLANYNYNAYYSYDYGKTWILSSSVILPGSNANLICMSISSSGEYAVFSIYGVNYPYYSNNYGKTWTLSIVSGGGSLRFNVNTFNGQYALYLNGYNGIRMSSNYGISYDTSYPIASELNTVDLNGKLYLSKSGQNALYINSAGNSIYWSSNTSTEFQTQDLAVAAQPLYGANNTTSIYNKICNSSTISGSLTMTFTGVYCDPAAQYVIILGKDVPNGTASPYISNFYVWRSSDYGTTFVNGTLPTLYTNTNIAASTGLLLTSTPINAIGYVVAYYTAPGAQYSSQLSTSFNSLLYSSDYGFTWQFAVSGDPNTTNTGPYGFFGPYALWFNAGVSISPYSSYAMTTTYYSNKLYYSSNGGINWLISNTNVDAFNTSCISGDGSSMYIGSVSILKSTNYGVSFFVVYPYSMSYRGMLCSVDGQIVTYTTGNGFAGKTSIDGGQTFTYNYASGGYIYMSDTGQYLVSPYSNYGYNLSYYYGYTVDTMSFPNIITIANQYNSTFTMGTQTGQIIYICGVNNVYNRIGNNFRYV